MERAFAPLRLPRSVLLALASMRDTVSAAQLSQIQAARDILSAVDSGDIVVADLPTDPATDPELERQAGGTWARLYELARRTGGRVVDFLPKINVQTGTYSFAAPSDAEERLVNCRSVIDALRSNGGLSEDDYLRGLGALGVEGTRPPAGTEIEVRAQLFCQDEIAKLFARSNLLRPACRLFRLSIPRADIDDLRTSVRVYERALDLAGWLDRLSEGVRNGLEAGTYEFLDPGPVPTEDTAAWEGSLDVRCLFELFTFKPNPSDVICTDDRCLNSYQRRDSVPIVTILEVLKALVSAKELTNIEYYRLLMRLRAGKVFFIPLEAGEILHHLLQARVNDGELTETPELGFLRRYWAASLASAAQAVHRLKPVPPWSAWGIIRSPCSMALRCLSWRWPSCWCGGASEVRWKPTGRWSVTRPSRAI